MTAFILSCEHASNHVPTIYLPYVKPYLSRLSTHEAYDLYAQAIAASLAKKLGIPLYAGNITRLLIDFNRSLHHPQCMALSKKLPANLKQTLIEDYYQCYRHTVLTQIEKALAASETVLHLSIHSFTPVLQGKARHADLCFLYDPTRQKEKKACTAWQKMIETHAPRLRIRRNYPYRGISDGFVTFCRTQFPQHRYLGIEIEMNQASLISKKERATFHQLILHAVTSTHPP